MYQYASDEMSSLPMGKLMKDDDDKTKEQLIHELTELRSQNAELKKSISGNISDQLATEELQFYAESIVETIRQPLLVLDADLKIISANRNFYRTFKVMSGETLGCFIYDLGNKQWDIPRLRELLEEVLPEKQVFDDFEVTHDFQDIGHKIMLLNARAIYRKEIGAKTILLAIEDITEHKQLEARLADSEKLFRRLFETASDGIVLLEKSEGKIVLSNSATEKMLGYSTQECIGSKLIDIGVKLDMCNFPELLHTLNTNGILNYKDMTITTKSGHCINTDIYMVNRSSVVQCNIRDTSERKLAEEGRVVLENHLFQAQKMEAIGTLAGGIAHDFNNVLAAIIGYTEMAIDESQNERQKHYLQETMKGAERATDMVRQILTFSRQDPQEKKPLEIKLLLKEAVKFLRASIPATIEIRQHITDESCSAMADPTQMHQVIMNLCTNATHAMKQAGGELTIDLSTIELSKAEIPRYPYLKPGSYLKLTVSDTGYGIDTSIMQRIFDPFFTTKSKNEGTGLGLSVVYGIVKSHDGFINVYSELGRGASFNVYLPRIIQDGVTIDTISGTMIGGTEEILLVDDEPALVDIGKITLSSLGYKVTGVTSSHEALDLFCAKPERFDLVITDMTLPQMTGIEFSRKILQIRPDIPIILCSGLRDLETEEQVKSMGIRAYCTKPLTRKDLSQVIRDTLDGYEQPLSRPIAGRNVQIFERDFGAGGGT
jgi:PAS domain S-box-containing protein